MGEPNTAALRCPRCQLAMMEVPNRRAVIDRCAGCNGIFFDQGEMIRLLGESADPKYWLQAASSRQVGLSEIDCPRCQTGMALRKLASEDVQVEVDHCGECGGLWLDGGEVDSVMRIGARQLARDKAAHAEPPAPDKKPKPTAAQTEAARAIFEFMTHAHGPKE
jgi:Zn-finger nucleic acid-binding protein